MESCKLQIGCMLIVLYILFLSIRERQLYRVTHRDKLFDWLLVVSVLSVLFDGATAWTVNHLDLVPLPVNGVLHACFLSSLDAMIFFMFLYMLDITRGLPQTRSRKLALALPLLLALAVVILFLPSLEYVRGTVTNYSMGVSVYACYLTVALYTLAAMAVLLHSWKQLNKHKRIIISTYMGVIVGVTLYQMLRPEALITALAPTFAVLGAYLNQESPLHTKLKRYNNEMMMGFATLVENRDDNTGGHIRRTTAYVRLLAEELKARGFYREELTRDYIENLIQAAPMHDIGKIAIPDAILQKPGKLTDEEFAIMKTHAPRGGQIIRDTFGHLENDMYEKIAYEVAVYHHEKWNGKGYPDGLTRKEIPLCARIMAIADVFDAVSAKRCYRDALPPDTCFRIIQEGSGQDFDPIMAEVFLDIREKIEKEILHSDQKGKISV
ncbi:MAG: HD-GYP domain-containing protein [Bacillota bacterium]|nr:HD-GYP domain-containing protein [Bacillota bacterium]